MPTYTVEVTYGAVGYDRPTPPDPPLPTTQTIFGYNTEDNGAPLSRRLTKWDNRAPCVRRYSGAAYNLNNGVFQFTTAVAPEKRISYSVKPNASGPYTYAGLASGAGNSMLTDWCESIPAGPWYVPLTYMHEVNDNIRNNDLTTAQYRNTYEQFRTAIDNATLQPGVQVKLASNFMAYKVAVQGSGPDADDCFFHDQWVPPPDVADLMTFDLYGNPGHFTTQVTGDEYGTSFPVVKTRFRDTFAAIERNGFAEHWGILELNTPPRDYDGPVNPAYDPNGVKQKRYKGGLTATGHNATHTEVERAKWLVDATEHCLHPPMAGSVPPEILLYWEHPEGVNWNQKFYDDRVWNALKPYIVGTPVGG